MLLAAAVPSPIHLPFQQYTLPFGHPPLRSLHIPLILLRDPRLPLLQLRNITL